MGSIRSTERQTMGRASFIREGIPLLLWKHRDANFPIIVSQRQQLLISPGNAIYRIELGLKPFLLPAVLVCQESGTDSQADNDNALHNACDAENFAMPDHGSLPRKTKGNMAEMTIRKEQSCWTVSYPFDPASKLSRAKTTTKKLPIRDAIFNPPQSLRDQQRELMG